nr:PREDICTED: esterase E4-like [Bemisia tabaci]XP_018911065.1 PREDICTED: esterase E4-like [Bemisia tabaci]XP_018911066.1 PREDICTED: esterase E4-like [Bemisia tabaci]XP_018911067.1 PREDICTED: esterase E4-like [Bemisia tabaci]
MLGAVVIYVLASAVFELRSSALSPVVKIADGEIAGAEALSWNGRPFYAFQGIPYAAPPIGKLRFKEPQPVKPWIGVWNASTRGSKCYAYDHGTYATVGAEDCLHLNVYTTKLPASNTNPSLDVIVFIHGGAFMFGSSNIYGPAYLLDSDADDIVFITLNYRLGPLGFLSTGDDVVSGNNGLKDQVAALKWIQKNVAAFGGNPQSVTIIGNSAGGASVQYHFLSPLSDGLFHRGFSQSGTFLNPWAFSENNVEKSHGLAANLGCPTHNSAELVECLRSRPAESIVLYSRHLQSWRYNPFSPWAPSVEANSSKAFLSEDPYKLLERGKIKDLPWLISFTSGEGLYPVGEYAENERNALTELDENWLEIAPHLLDFAHTVPQDDHKEYSAEIRLQYFGNRSVSPETFENLIQVVGDRLYMVGIQQAVRFQAAANKSPVYLLHFASPIEKSLSTKFCSSTKNYGVSHADDLGYILQASWGQPWKSKEEWAKSRLLINVWLSFAKTGVPSVGSTEWLPVSRNIKRTGDIDYVKINSYKDVESMKKPSLNFYEFWTSFAYSPY